MQWMSFALTPGQMRAKTKTVTRRLGWKNLQPGTLLHAAERTRGLTLAERSLFSLGIIRVVSVRREPLDAITADDVVKEGFPELALHGEAKGTFLNISFPFTEWPFIDMFCKSHGCETDTTVTRIEFAFADGKEQ